MYINSAKDSKMRTTREFIEYLRRAADDIETMLENGEITDDLVLEPNTYGLGCPFLATYDGFISLNHPARMTNDEEDEYGI